MNRREMLATGFRRLVRALPGLTKGSLGSVLTGRAVATPPPPEALSFPRQTPEPARPGPNSIKED